MTAVNDRVVAFAVAALAAVTACKKGGKRELGLAGRDGGVPVVVVEEASQSGGAVGPLEREVEPNDHRDQAAPLPVPGGVDGEFSRPDDVDFYRLEAGAARVVGLRLSGAAADEGSRDLVLELQDTNGKLVARSDRGPAGTLEGLPNAPLAQGAVHYVSVSQFLKKGAGKARRRRPGAAGAESGAAASSRYQLTIETVIPGPDEEVEPNDRPEGARPVLLAEDKSGYLGWSKDEDLWLVSLTGFSAGFVLDVAVDGVDGASLAVDILAHDGRVLAARRGQKDRSLLVRGLLPELGAQFYLARVSGSRSNPEQRYHVRPTSRQLGDGDEAEPNDDIERAIAAGTLVASTSGERRGLLDGGDTDVYRFEASREPLSFSVAVEPPATTDVVLRVLGPSGAEVARADVGKVGQREELGSLMVGRGEVRFVAVSGTALGDEEDSYVLRWSSAVDGRGPASSMNPAEPSDQPPVDDPYGRQ